MSNHTTQDIEAVTRMVVERYTYEGFLFTALDVSNTVKQQLPGIRHREVAPIVRDLFQDGAFGDDYERTTIDVTLQNGSTTQALLYHLEDDEPDDYAGTQRQQVAIPPVPVSTSGPVAAAPATDSVAVDVGRDGRARIPRAFVQQAGITTDEVLVCLQGAGPQLLLCAPSQSQTPTIARLKCTHPTILYVPLSLLTNFDLTKPLVATKNPQGIIIDGTPAN